MSNTKTNLTRRIDNPESDVAEPVAVRNTVSLTAQITELTIGQCCSRVERLDGDMTMSDFVTMAGDMKARLRNNMAPSVRGAKVKTGGEYTIEVTTTVTVPGYIYLVGIVTRIG
jgi:hypothetical protein